MYPTALAQPLSHQFSFALLLSLAIACVSWTITHEEVFREPREFCQRRSRECKQLYQRKFFYLFTCEYCFSHYVTAFFLLLTQFQMLYQGWRGFVISEFTLVWLANIYMGAFRRLRLEIKAEDLSIVLKKSAIDQQGASPPASPASETDHAHKRSE